MDRRPRKSKISRRCTRQLDSDCVCLIKCVWGSRGVVLLSVLSPWELETYNLVLAMHVLERLWFLADYAFVCVHMREKEKVDGCREWYCLCACYGCCFVMQDMLSRVWPWLYSCQFNMVRCFGFTCVVRSTAQVDLMRFWGMIFIRPNL